MHHGDVLSLQQGAPNKHGNGKRRAASHGGHAHLGFTAAGNKFVDLRQAKVPPHAACLCMPLPSPSPMQTHHAYALACSSQAFFVFSYPESASPLDEDRSTIIRCLVLRKLLSDSLMCRIVLQLNRARDKQLALDLGVNSVTSLNELKMAILALSWYARPLPPLTVGLVPMPSRYWPQDVLVHTCSCPFAPRTPRQQQHALLRPHHAAGQPALRAAQDGGRPPLAARQGRRPCVVRRVPLRRLARMPRRGPTPGLPADD